MKQVLEKALYIDPELDKRRTRIEDRARSVRLRVAKVQFGVWYKPSNTPGAGRSFSIEYERDFINQSAAYLYVVYEHKLIRVDVCVTLLSLQSPLHLKFPLDRSAGDRRNELSGSGQVLEHPKDGPWP